VESIHVWAVQWLFFFFFAFGAVCSLLWLARGDRTVGSKHSKAERDSYMLHLLQTQCGHVSKNINGRSIRYVRLRPMNSCDCLTSLPVAMITTCGGGSRPLSSTLCGIEPWPLCPFPPPRLCPRLHLAPRLLCEAPRCGNLAIVAPPPPPSSPPFPIHPTPNPAP
jgi:hypothetical protein